MSPVIMAFLSDDVLLKLFIEMLNRDKHWWEIWLAKSSISQAAIGSTTEFLTERKKYHIFPVYLEQ